MSITVCHKPFNGCLVALNELLGPNRTWRSTNYKQDAFLLDHAEAQNTLSKIPELKYMASDSAGPINKFFADNGFPEIELDDFAPGEIGAGSVLDLLVEWLKEGIDRDIKDPDNQDKVYKGFVLKNDHINHFSSALDGNPVTSILTKSLDKVYITMPSEAPKDQFELLKNAKSIISDQSDFANYNNLIMPCVELDQWVNADWILGLSTTDDKSRDWFISKALQKTRLKINKKGARVQSAAAVMVRLTTCVPIQPPPDHIINKPFYFIVERPGLGLIAAAYVDKEDWKDPGDNI